MPSSKTHTAFGFTALILYIQFSPEYIEYNYVEMISGVVLGSTFPDIDVGTSWVSQLVPWLDDVLRKLGVLKHRGITHSVWCILLFASLMYGFRFSYFTTCLLIGICSHIMLDFLTFNIIRVRCGEHKQNHKKHRKKTAWIEPSFLSENILYNTIWIVNFGMLTSMFLDVNYLNIILVILNEFGLKF